jgi:hypothetical protein
MPTVVVREDSNLVGECEYCHLTAIEAVAVLRHRLDKRQRTEACGGCTRRLQAEVTAQLKGRRAS